MTAKGTPSETSRHRYILANHSRLSNTLPLVGYWTADLIDDPSLLRKCKQAEVIESRWSIAPGGNEKKVWHVKENAKNTIEAMHSPDEALPCGHPFRIDNIGDFVQCKTCNARFTPEEVREHNGA